MTRHEMIVTRLKAGLTVEAICKELGVTPEAVSNVANKEGLVLPKRKRGPKPLTEMEPVSRLAQHIGREVFFYRQVHNDISIKELATRLGMSVTNLQRCESGFHDFTISEVERIARTIGKPPTELVTLPIIKFGGPRGVS
jgi:transcriptional regulator with XRE-family HTH domain